MDSSKVLIIVPRLPPSIDGVGDFAMALTREMRTMSKHHFEFVVCDPTWKGQDSIDGMKVHKLETRSAKALNDILAGTQSVFLQYVGYGYARRGSPVWLLQALKKWKKVSSTNRLITMFHELHAFGPVWTSQFWTSPLQKYIATKLMLLSNHAITSKQGYAVKIEKLSKGLHKNVKSIPVFSNVGEPTTVKPFSERQSVVVIFGSPGPKKRVYRNSLKELARVCHELKIEKIIDIGKSVDECPEDVDGIPIIKKGILPQEEISNILSEAKAGFINYPSEFLSKSGIFAAYCAHGILPLGVTYLDQAVDQVEAEKHYWPTDIGKTISSDIAEKISREAFRWYQDHRLSVQAQIFNEKLS